jgi:hypothetical protein
VFHVGMPKCGSTYLQRLIFPKLPGLRYIEHGGQMGSGTVAERLERLDGFLAETAQETVLFSAESLCGHPANKASYGDFLELLPHIPAAHEVSVVVVVRRQDSFIDSMYRHHVRKGGRLDFEEFFALDRNEQIVAGKVSDGTLHQSYCDYSRFLDYARRRPGLSLTFIPFELMQSDLKAFVRRVADAAGVEGDFDIPDVFVNRGPSGPEFSVQKKLNKLARSSGASAAFERKVLVGALRAAEGLARIHYVPIDVLSDDDRRKILDHYRGTNRAVADASPIGRELSTLGYC